MVIAALFVLAMVKESGILTSDPVDYTPKKDAAEQSETVIENE